MRQPRFLYKFMLRFILRDEFPPDTLQQCRAYAMFLRQPPPNDSAGHQKTGDLQQADLAWAEARLGRHGLCDAPASLQPRGAEARQG